MSFSQIISGAASYLDDCIEADYIYETTSVNVCKSVASGPHLPCEQDSALYVNKKKHHLRFRTEKKVSRLGVMLVGIGGNNGSTVIAGILANKRNLTWKTKTGVKKANWFGSLMLASTTRIGHDSKTHDAVYASLSSLLPISYPESWCIGGWDINDAPLGDAMRRAQVLDIQLQDQLYDEMQSIVPLPGVYIPNFVAENQSERANNVIPGDLSAKLEALRQHIRDFKKNSQVNSVIVLWTATTERFCTVMPGIQTSALDLLASISCNHPEISPSTLYAVAAVLEGCSFINGAPQNTIVPGVIELARQKNVFVGGDDFKSGQTKLKSVLIDFLVSAGMKPTSIVSYNHLGNNDGQNLSSFPQFRSKEISKSNVVDDMVRSNKILYSSEKDYPDHCVVIKYVPFVGDSKRAMDEYSSEIFLNGINTIVVHNTCEDSLLAAPLILDLVILTELFQRITVKCVSDEKASSEFTHFHTVLSILSYLCKAPLVPEGTPVVNALMVQRYCIVNVLRACLGLPPEHHMLLEHKIPPLMQQ